MPLEHSSSDAALKRNIGSLMGEVGKSPHVQSRAQALAIAFETQRRGRAYGDGVHGYDDGGAVQSVLQALQAGAGIGGKEVGATNQAAPSSPQATAQTNGVAPAAGNAMGAAAPSGGLGAPPAAAPAGFNPATPMANPPAGQASQSPANPPAGMMGDAGPPVQSGLAPPPTGGGFNSQGFMVAPGQLHNPAGAVDTGSAPMLPPGMADNPINKTLMNTGGRLEKRAIGGFNMAKSPHLAPSWTEKAEAKGMMHVGPIHSIVPGRTDNHAAHVPSGSYVIPAATISSMGQGNTNAGLAIAHQMFGTGPFGAPLAKMGHGPGAPKPPKPMKFESGGYSEGGTRGHGDHIPVPVLLSGGEFVIAPSKVREIGKGSLKNGHAILDAFILHNRAKEIKTLKGLPGPAKR